MDIPEYILNNPERLAAYQAGMAKSDALLNQIDSAPSGVELPSDDSRELYRPSLARVEVKPGTLERTDDDEVALVIPPGMTPREWAMNQVKRDEHARVDAGEIAVQASKIAGRAVVLLVGPRR